MLFVQLFGIYPIGYMLSALFVPELFPPAPFEMLGFLPMADSFSAQKFGRKVCHQFGAPELSVKTCSEPFVLCVCSYRQRRHELVRREPTFSFLLYLFRLALLALKLI